MQEEEDMCKERNRNPTEAKIVALAGQPVGEDGDRIIQVGSDWAPTINQTIIRFYFSKVLLFSAFVKSRENSESVIHRNRTNLDR